MLGKVKRTNLGQERIPFVDALGCECLLQESVGIPASTTAPTSAIWLGATDRMLLDRGMVASLILHLQTWLRTGSFVVEPPETPMDLLGQIADALSEDESIEDKKAYLEEMGIDVEALLERSRKLFRDHLGEETEKPKC